MMQNPPNKGNLFNKVTITRDEIRNLVRKFRRLRTVMWHFRQLAEIRGLSHDPEFCIYSGYDGKGNLHLANFVREKYEFSRVA